MEKMTTQEDIREHLAVALFKRHFCRDMNRTTDDYDFWLGWYHDYHPDEYLKQADAFLTYLHSKGVVIKGNSEIPFCGRQMHTVEPLITA